MAADAWFEPIDEGRYLGTEHTAGPWDPRAMHFGPPAALLARHVLAADGGADKQLGRITFEVLRPVPVGELEVATSVVRQGRRVDLVEAELVAAGDVVARSRAWRMLVQELDLPAGTEGTDGDRPTLRPLPDEADADVRFFDVGWDVGYHTSIEWRAIDGDFASPGPSTMWLRPTVDLVAGTQNAPVEALLSIADSGNGISAWFQPAEWFFINTELTVHLHHQPIGDWVGMRAETLLNDAGIGLAWTELYDVEGRVGRGAQQLYTGRR